MYGDGARLPRNVLPEFLAAPLPGTTVTVSKPRNYATSTTSTIDPERLAVCQMREFYSSLFKDRHLLRRNLDL
jgi:hypothetical protein